MGFLMDVRWPGQAVGFNPLIVPCQCLGCDHPLKLSLSPQSKRGAVLSQHLCTERSRRLGSCRCLGLALQAASLESVSHLVAAGDLTGSISHISPPVLKTKGDSQTTAERESSWAASGEISHFKHTKSPSLFLASLSVLHLKPSLGHIGRSLQ